ncbi:MAG: pilus assembly protein PilM [Desulfobacterales bacterium]|jgi:type IV pilus assembly protein PilM
MIKIKSSYPIGLDIGKDHIYAAQFKSGKKLAIRGLWHKSLNGASKDSDESNDLLVPFLKQIAEHKKFKGKKVVVHIPPQEIFSFPIRFNVHPGESLEAVMVRESEKYLPFSIEEAVIDYPSISSPSSEGYTVTIVATRRKQIEHYLTVLKQSGLSAEVFDFGVSALLRLHHFLFAAAEDPIVLCNVGYTGSMIAIVHKDIIFANRHIDWGTKALIENLQQNFEHLNDPKKAGLFLKKYGLLYDNQKNRKQENQPSNDPEIEKILKVIYQISTPHIEELINECHQIMAYVRSEFSNPPFAAIYIYGLATIIENLDQYFEMRLGIPTKRVNPLLSSNFEANKDLSDITEGASFALALGTALRPVTWL